MNIGEIQEYKLEIGENRYTFRLDFEALMKFSKRYKSYDKEPVLINGQEQYDKDGNVIVRELNAIDIFNKFINTIGDYDSLIKILSCSCVEKDLDEEEMRKNISWDFPTMVILDQIANNMIAGSLKLNNPNNKGNENNSKN